MSCCCTTRTKSMDEDAMHGELGVYRRPRVESAQSNSINLSSLGILFGFLNLST